LAFDGLRLGFAADGVVYCLQKLSIADFEILTENASVF
jgi:hypothetical protein